MILYAHPHTIRYTDYGSHLETVQGLSWSHTGKAQDAMGFERGSFDALLREKQAEIDSMLAERPGLSVAICVGEPVTRKVDMNPHGLM